MKIIGKLLLALLAIGFSKTANGQSITINSVSGTNFCAADSFSVTFTVSGTWGHKDAFTLQLSDPTVSFSNTFTNIGSIADTASRIFTVQTMIPE